MNSLSAINGWMPGYWLDSVTAFVAGQILDIRKDFGFRAVAAGNDHAAARPTKSPGEQSGHVTSASGRLDIVAKPRPAGANYPYGRFQRDIVPHLDAAYNFARFLSRNPDAAQDIVQEAFLRAYRSFDGYQGGDARAWIFAIVRNCYHNWLLDHRRKARVEIDTPRSQDPSHDSREFSIDDVASDEDTPEAALLRSGESNSVRIVLNKLPRALREVLVLRELEGLSYRQIAETFALPIGTVMSRLARARTQFESAWRQQTGFGEDRT
jgi:RNA polymerase sigma factor (sigma-70 family)